MTKARVSNQIGNTYFEQGKHEKAIEQYDLAIDLCSEALELQDHDKAACAIYYCNRAIAHEQLVSYRLSKSAGRFGRFGRFGRLGRLGRLGRFGRL